MSDLLRSELLKLRTTRTALWLALAAAALATLSTTAGLLLTGDREVARAEWQADVAAFAASSIACALLLGILVVTNEFRHGTITPSLLAAPRRVRVLVAKIVAGAVGGALLVLLAASVVYAIAVPWLLARGVGVHLFEAHPLESIGLRVLTGALCGAVGVGLGAAVRSQVGAIVGAVAWLFVLEPLVARLLPDAAPYLPGAALSAVAFAVDTLSRPEAIALSLGWVVVVGGLGAALVARRDVT